MGGKRGANGVLMGGHLKERDDFGALRRRLQDSIKIDLKEIGCEGVDWIHFAQG